MSSTLPREVAVKNIRWWPLLLILLLGAGLLYAVQNQGLSVIRPSFDFAVIIGLINLLVYMWIRGWSNLCAPRQITTTTILALIQATFALLFRYEEFTGDGRIIFQWRWTHTPEQRLADYSSKVDESATFANLADSGEADSPAYRGVDRTGRYQVHGLGLNWHQHPPRELWRHPVGRGWSSFAVVGNFCVTQEQHNSTEAVVCYELSTGREVWKHLDDKRFNEITSGPGPRATPAIHAGRVFSFGATGTFNCLDGTNGRVIWSQDLAEGSTPLFGYCSSPLIHATRVFVTPGGKAGSIVAMDIETGEKLWSKDSRKPGYSSPVLLKTTSDDQILVFDAIGLHGYAAESGDRRWTFQWGDNSDDQVNVCQPAILGAPLSGTGDTMDAAQLLISSGYGRGTAVVSISRTNSGEWIVREKWRSKALKSKFSDVIIHNQHAYGLDEGILTCISLADGSRQWKNGRYGYGQLILVNETLLIQTEFGKVVLVRTDPSEFSEVASLDALRDRTWNQPVIAGNKLLVRNDREAVCFELPDLRAADF